MARVWQPDNGSHRPPSFHASDRGAGKGNTWLWVGQLLWCQEAALGWLSFADAGGYTWTKCLYPTKWTEIQMHNHTVNAHHRGLMETFYPVLCLDHQWEWEWRWVGCCGCAGPSANDSSGDIRKDIPSSQTLGELPPGQEREEEGEGRRAPALPSRHLLSHLLSVSFNTEESATSLLSLRKRTQREADENKSYKHTHIHKAAQVKNSRCKPCLTIMGCSSVQMHPLGLSSAR